MACSYNQIVRYYKLLIVGTIMNVLGIITLLFAMGACLLRAPQHHTPYTQEEIEILNEHGLTHKDQLWVKACEIEHHLEILDQQTQLIREMYNKIREEIHEVSVPHKR